MHLPEIDKYADVNSVFHSWDPRLKVISMGILIISIALLPNHTSALAGLVLSSAFIVASRIPIRFILKQLKWVTVFILFFLIVMPLTAGGEKITVLNCLTVSLNGLRFASLIALRAISICLLIFPMMATTKFHKSLKALQSIRVPNKLIQMIMFTYRYIFVFIEEIGKMLRAASSRLFKKRTNIFTLKIIGNLTGMLFVRAFERTERVYDAMVSRGYKGNLIVLEDFKVCRRDFAKAGIVIILAFGLHMMRYVL